MIFMGTLNEFFRWRRILKCLASANTFSSLHRRIRLEGQITAANLQKVFSPHTNSMSIMSNFPAGQFSPSKSVD